MPREAVQTLSFRGRRSRNKVSVGEPAEGSLPVFPPALVRTGSSGLFLWGGVGFGRRLAICVLVCWGASRRLGERDAGTARSLVQPCDALEFAGRETCGSELVPPRPTRKHLRVQPRRSARIVNTQLLSMDILALATMKNAAKCDT